MLENHLEPSNSINISPLILSTLPTTGLFLQSGIFEADQNTTKDTPTMAL